MTPAEIAAKLTPAQVRALRWCADNVPDNDLWPYTECLHEIEDEIRAANFGTDPVSGGKAEWLLWTWGKQPRSRGLTDLGRAVLAELDKSRCCMGLPPEECAWVPSRHCERMKK